MLDRPLKKLPALILLFMSLVAPIRLSPSVGAQSNFSPAEEIPTIDFCEIIKHPRRYFDQIVRIEAQWQSGHEFAYLTSDRCAPKFRHEIAVKFAQPLSEQIRKSVRQIQSHEYGGRATIRAVGTLRNPGKYYGYFRYRFEIVRIEEVAHIVVRYQRTLEPGKTYRASVRADRVFGLALVPSLIIPNLHFATRIEWINISNFPALEKMKETDRDLQIVFSVISDDIKQMTERRWNRTFHCKIIWLE